MPSQENGVTDIGMGMSFTKYPTNPITTKLTVMALQIWKHSRKIFINETLLVLQEGRESDGLLECGWALQNTNEPHDHKTDSNWFADLQAF